MADDEAQFRATTEEREDQEEAQFRATTEEEIGFGTETNNHD